MFANYAGHLAALVMSRGAVQNFWELVLMDAVGSPIMNHLNVFALLVALLLTPFVRSQEPPRRASANNDLAFQLLRQFDLGNQIISPHSIRTAFALCVAGTDGATKKEIEQVLGLGGGIKTHAEIAKLQAELDAAGRGKIKLRAANRLWGDDQGGYFEQPYLDFTRKYYGAGFSPVDFGRPEVARGVINRWVSDLTAGNIPQLLPKESITADTAMVITNAIYFLGHWQEKFDVNRTRDMLFHVNAKENVQVPFMQRTGEYGVAETQGCTALALPYQGGELRMIVMLPDGDLAAFQKQLTGATYAKLRAALRIEEVALSMPRFKLQEAYPLHSSVLPAMGMQASFAPSYDWKPLNGGKHQMYISGVFHSAMIDVNESGTEAAAATAIVVPKEMACMSRGLRLDRPFAFAIEHTKTGHILFAGHVANPFRAKP